MQRPTLEAGMVLNLAKQKKALQPPDLGSHSFLYHFFCPEELCSFCSGTAVGLEVPFSQKGEEFDGVVSLGQHLLFVETRMEGRWELLGFKFLLSVLKNSLQIVCGLWFGYLGGQ